MNYLRIYTGPDGQTDVADVEVSTVQRELFPGIHPFDVAQPIPVSSVILLRYPEQATWEPGWHNAPRRQFFILTKDVEVEVSDGQRRHVSAGTPVLVEDTTGKGHRTRALAEGDVLLLFLPLVE
jgi:hypothetical protein